MKQWLLNLTWWFSGSDTSTLQNCPYRDKALRSALGLVFILNYAALLLVWVKVCVSYFGWAGLLPGLIVPSVFLALDRIIAMRHRHLTGVLAVYSIGQADDKTEFKLRIAIALALSVATTFTFQLAQANSLIREKAHAQWQAANAVLRHEIVSQVNAEYNQHIALLNQSENSLKELRDITSDSLADAKNAAKESSSTARAARNQMSYEKGGIDGRPAGEKRKFHAQKELAEFNEGIASVEQSRQQSEKRALQVLDNKLSKVASDRLNVQKDKTHRLSEVDALMRIDPRFVPQKSGIFSDATIFVGLFFDPDVAVGMWLISMMLWVILLMVELSALIAIAMLPTSPYDIALVVNLRVEAAKLVTAAEIKLTQEASQSQQIFVRARPMDNGQNPHNPINNAGVNHE